MNKNKPNILKITNLFATVDDIAILNGINLEINQGEIHVLMGPNGSGKSTLSKVVAGHPAYKITNGEIIFKKKNLLELEPEERSNFGLFLAFQYPLEITGVTNEEFLRAAYNSKQKYLNLPEVDPIEFFEIITKKLIDIKIDISFLSRNVNEGFSGGEKKRNEILQLALLDSDLAILDEIDSGLDIDALKLISQTINNIISKNTNKSLLIVTHYQRLLDYIRPTFIHVMDKGKIIKTGNWKLANELEKKGYDWLKK
uniref:sulfate ABC transporter protein n=1 Tax=Merotricha bacillata TaxID=658122 RepID=UPI002114A01B|nr:sulfate ABC transporter protein [Merotricha bacillata]UTE94517.1 sulfate ABC transporter protein [Merotricha bacillata]